MTKKKRKRKTLDIGHYVVAFIDLLGQQEQLRNLKDLPNKNDPDSREGFVKTLGKIYMPVKFMRTSFQQYFDSFYRQYYDASRFTEEQLNIFKKMRSCPIKSQPLSDAVVISVPLRIDGEYKLPIRGVFGVFTAAATTSLLCLAAGHPLRGGIDVGVAMEMSKNEIYGAALARAHTLESEVAQYPRIVLGQELIQYLHGIAKQEPTDIYAKLGKRMAEDCLALVAEDIDGHPILDYLGEGIHKRFADIIKEIDKDLIKKAYRYVIQCFEKYRREQNSKLAFRYAHLRNYFSGRRDLWFKDEADLADLKQFVESEETIQTTDS